MRDKRTSYNKWLSYFNYLETGLKEVWLHFLYLIRHPRTIPPLPPSDCDLFFHHALDFSNRFRKYTSEIEHFAILVKDIESGNKKDRFVSRQVLKFLQERWSYSENVMHSDSKHAPFYLKGTILGNNIYVK